MDEIGCEPESLIEQAMRSASAGDWLAALSDWLAVRTKLSDQPTGHWGVVECLRELGRFEEADAAALRGLMCFPGDLAIAVSYASVAVASARWEEALRRWERLREQFPLIPAGYAGAADALRELRRYEEAAALLVIAKERFPGDSEIAAKRILIDHAQARWPAALAGWEAFRRAFAFDPSGFWGAGEALRNIGRYEEADRVLRDGLSRFPNQQALLFQYALCAHSQENWSESQVRWSLLRQRCPSFDAGYAGEADALRALGRLDEADELLRYAIHLFPRSPTLMISYCRVAHSRDDLEDLLRRLDRLEEQFPGHKDVWFEAGAFRLAAALAGSESTADNVPFAEDKEDSTYRQALDAVGLRDLMLCFESLGEDCEFGVVQRRFGAEPLGLLRWSSTLAGHLITALSNDLAGIGDPVNTLMMPDNGVYFTEDLRYGMHMDTFIKEAPVDPPFAEQCRRLRYLANKLRNDLRCGEKIFVHKCAVNISGAQIQELHSAVRRHGRGWLLLVRVAEGHKYAPSVEVIQDGLMLAWIDRFSPDAHPDFIDYESWLTICRKALYAVRRLEPSTS